MKIIVSIFICLLFCNEVVARNEIVTSDNNTDIIHKRHVEPAELEKALGIVNNFTSKINTSEPAPGWDSSSSLLKKNFSKQDWKSVFKDINTKFGKRLSSKFLRALRTNKFPDMPEGNYLVVALATEFKNKSLVTENIALLKEQNNWSLAGYHIDSSPDKEKVFVPFVEMALNRIDSWNISDYKELMTEEGFSIQPDWKWKEMLDQSKTLGRMLSHETPQLVTWTHFNSYTGSDRTEAVYQSVVQYEARKLLVTLTLIHKDGATKIHGLRFQDP